MCRLEGTLLQLQERKKALPSYLLRVDRELVLLGRMETLMEELLATQDQRIFNHLLLEGIVSLSGAKGGILLLRRELEETPSATYHSSSLEGLQVEFSLSGFIGTQPGAINPSSERIESALHANNITLDEEFMYIPVGLFGRMLGLVILMMEGKLDEITQKVIGLFTTRAGLMLDRLSFVNRLKKEYEQRQRETVLLQERLQLRHTELELRFSRVGIIGHSRSMQRVYELIDRASGLSIPILIQGETGTGKELVARAIHHFSPRRERPFLAINCAAMPEAILDSELFGHIKGAFTGAERDRQGLFEASHTGTLFLDEIAEMSHAMQAKLLRVIERGEVRPVGGTHPVRVDVRIITATNQNLKDLVDQGKFRQDLFYRLNIMPINLPALRERKEDIPLLVSHFLGRVAPEVSLDTDAVERLKSHSWPGNVRELENLLLQLVSLGRKKIRTQDIRFTEAGKIDPIFLPGKTLREMEKEALRRILLKALEEANWDTLDAARRLKVPRRTLYYKLIKAGIKRQRL
jgi:DNA-binding NtrC family response regulator